MSKRKRALILTDLEITGIADKGKAVGREPEGRVVFVEGGAVPGDCVDVLVNKARKGYYMGKMIALKRPSSDRVEPFCQHFGVCGGCKWQHLDYEAQLRHKQEVVESALRHLGKMPVGEILPILPAPETRFYRNKLEFSCSNKRWLTREEMADETISNRQDVVGFHPAGAFDKIIDIEQCWLQSEPSNALRNAIRELAQEQGLEFYDAAIHQGYLRNFIVRTSSLGQTMLLLSVGRDEPKKLKRLTDSILERFPELTTLMYCINGKLNDSYQDLDFHALHGPGYIEEQLGTVRFRVGPKSFFQTNTQQAENLYATVAEFAGLDGSQNLYDLYTGVGSIGLYLAAQCRQVVGIEEIPAAIEDAKVNAAINGIENCRFYAGDVRHVLSEDFAREHGLPDVVVTDPPRAGMHADVVQMLLQLAAPLLVYVSCNPATQARDFQLLHEKYDLLKIRAVDMFPHTHHVETVAVLKLRS
jgi:23S rRNA (uracil1939-C5)-methyltransferase